MSTLLEEIVITDGNEKAFNLVLNCTQSHEGMINAYIYGPSGSGKTMLATARANEVDLLSTRRAMVVHPAELVLYLTSLYDQGEKYLDRVAKIDVLFIDSFEEAFTDSNKDIAPKALELLIQERTKGKLDTFIFSQHPLLDFAEHKDLYLILSQFESIHIEALSKDERIELFKKIQDSLSDEKRKSRTLSSDAIEFLATDPEVNLSVGQRMVKALLTSDYFEPGVVITRSMINTAVESESD